ncbi:MAG TPA: YciI family protein [Solirubrobacteraceae bacterium]|nr:YciI family protein [Solirubrobacteraceae bacterium]
MGKYVFTYSGGGMAATEGEREAVMAAWGRWFEELGPAVLDMGNPFAGSTSIGSSAGDGLTGYSIVEADSLEAARGLAEGCPVLERGGGVAVYETLAM